MLRFAAIGLMVLCCGCQQLAAWKSPRPAAESKVQQTRYERDSAPHTIYVTSNGFHTGVVLRTADVPRRVWPEVDRLPEHTWIEVGWGSEIFYRATAITPRVVVGAVFPNPSVLHLVGWDDSPEHVFAGDVIRLEIDNDEFTELCQHIHDSYEFDDRGQAEYLGPGIYGDSAFFRARGNYYFPNTCNVWTAKALRKAGVPAIPQVSVLAGPVVGSARRSGTTIRQR